MITDHELRAAVWRTSSYSNAEGGACVAVADGFPGVMPVRDTKCPDGPSLVFPSASWSTFVADVKAQAAPAD